MSFTRSFDRDRLTGRYGHLAAADAVRHAERVDDEQGIYRVEVLAIMGALADLTVDVQTILRYIEGDDEDEAQEEDLPDA
jgi:hypothetical protein